MIRVVAIAFPGGYRFLSVVLVSLIFSDVVAEGYSKGFFWVLLIVSMSGMPLSAVMSSRLYYISRVQLYISVMASVSFVTMFLYLFFLREEDYSFCIDVYFSALLLSFYEVTRKHFFNLESYLVVFIASCISITALLLILLTPLNFLLTVTFFILFIPIFIARVFVINNTSKINRIENKMLLLKYNDFFLSNIFSTSLNSAVPLLLIMFSGDAIAPKVAIVFSVSSVLLMVPRVIAVNNIGKLRRLGASKNIVYSFYKLMQYYLVLVGTISLVAIYKYYSGDWLVLWLLLFGVLFSQIYLPFSSLLSVEGLSRKLLIINFKGTVLFLSLTIFSYFVFNEDFVSYFMLSFTIHHCYKLWLTKRACNNLYDF